MSIASFPTTAEKPADGAARTAEVAAQRAGVEIRPLADLGDIRAACELLDDVWGDGGPVSANLLVGAMSAGSYLTGAYAGGDLVGMCLALWGPPPASVLYSHIAGVSATMRGRDVGSAIKLHQRAAALARGVDTITWTYDPLVARNAHFNIRKLGARPVVYHVDHYGPMRDAINGDDETDRLLVRWQLDSEETRAALARHAAGLEGAPAVVLACGSDGYPQRRGEAGSLLQVSVPADIEQLRRTDPAAARAWRIAVRDTLGDLLSRDATVVDFDRASSAYLLRKDISA
ncbi:GNAT family N-acetyltransferase [Microbacterium sp. NPDC089695]|uniref:GNAT family N-acetyltransferase n=1 Tax=Microbacterium sp. NPDC089695 TaxID=3364198 RepID=UPI0037F8BD1B